MQQEAIKKILNTTRPGNTHSLLDLSNSSVTDNTMVVVTQALKKPDCHVRSLHLSNNHSGISPNSISPTGISTLVDTLTSGYSSLTSLYLANLGLDDECIRTLSQAFKSTYSMLATLDISSNRVTHTGIVPLVEAIIHPSCRLLSLNLAFNQLYDGAILALLPTLVSPRTIGLPLITLCITGATIHPDTMAAFATALASPDCHLATLQMSHTPTPSSSALLSPLFPAITRPESPLLSLDLASANLTLDAIRLLNEAFRSNHLTITALDLSQNSLPEEGPQTLFTVLAQHDNQLLSLNLNENTVDPAGAKAAGVLLQSPKCKLHHLCLADTSLHNLEAKEISQALSSYRELTILDLSGNKINNKGVRDFLNTISSCNTLTDLKFTTDGISEDVKDKLAAFLKRNLALYNAFVSMVVANEHLPQILPLMETTPPIYQRYALMHLTNVLSQQRDDDLRASYLHRACFLMTHGVTPLPDTLLKAKFSRQPDLITLLNQHSTPSLIQSPGAEAQLQVTFSLMEEQYTAVPAVHLEIKGTDTLIGDPGAKTLSAYLMTLQRPVISVNLEHNNISDIGGQELLQAIKANPRITSFNGMHTLMSAAMLQAIQECIASHTTTSASLLTMVRDAIQHVNDLTPLVTTLRTQKPSTAERCQALAAVITDVGKQPICTFEQAHAISMVAWLLKQGFTVDEQVRQAATTLNHAAILLLIAHPPAVTTPASSATTLDLSYQSINDTTIKKIIQQLLDQPYRHALNLSGNPLTDHGIKIVAKALTSVPKHPLRQLTLSAMQLTTLSVNELMPYLCQHTCALMDLDLSHNQLGDGSIMQLAHASESYWRGETINLDFNFIGDCGADVLATVLARSSSQLTSISLRYNRISDAGAKRLLQALEQRLQQGLPPVTILDLTGNPISDDLQAQLSHRLECHAKVKLTASGK